MMRLLQQWERNEIGKSLGNVLSRCQCQRHWGLTECEWCTGCHRPPPPVSPAATLLSSANTGPAETHAPIARDDSLSGGSANERRAWSGSRRVCQPLPHQSSSKVEVGGCLRQVPPKIASFLSLQLRKYVARTPIYTAAALNGDHLILSFILSRVCLPWRHYKSTIIHTSTSVVGLHKKSDWHRDHSNFMDALQSIFLRICHCTFPSCQICGTFWLFRLYWCDSG